MKKRKKLSLNRETLQVLRNDPARDAAGAAIGRLEPIGFPTWPTCPDSGCYVCSGATCSMGCGGCGAIY